jgi:histidinol-phosphate/aromatic aminotransferase/cobyric acid decarboxylase-like protein
VYKRQLVANGRIVKTLRENGCLWNVNSIAEVWLERLQDADVVDRYRTATDRYLRVCEQFSSDIGNIFDGGRIRAIPSRSNFMLLEDMGGTSALEMAARMMYRHGIYVRACDDKVGLGPTFVRVSARTRRENGRILEALADVCDD